MIEFSLLLNRPFICSHAPSNLFMTTDRLSVGVTPEALDGMEKGKSATQYKSQVGGGRSDE